MKKLSPDNAARHLESLLLCMQLARQYGHEVVQEALLEVNLANDMDHSRMPILGTNWRTPERASDHYVRACHDKAWRDKFETVRKMLHCPEPGEFCEHLDGGIEACVQYNDGLITFEEFVYWLCDALAKFVGPEILK